MSLKKQAAQVRAKGRKNIGEDSVLAHISPKEAALLKARGGSGRIDPHTGLPHFDEGEGNGASGGMSDGYGGGFTGGYTGGWGTSEGGYGDRGPNGSSGPMGVASDGYGGAGYSSDASGGLDSTFNAAMDSQQANIDNSFDANPSFAGYTTSPVEDQSWSLDKMMKNPIVSALMSVHPVTRAVQVGYGMLNAKSPMDAASKALGAFGGPIGSMASMGLNAATSSNPSASLGKSAASSIGGMVGSAIGGPVGGAIGGLAGGYAAGQGNAGMGTANGGAQGNTGSQGGVDYSALANGLGGIYANYKAGQQANSAADSLKDLYSPNGAFAQQMRQNLERKDAAAGRRSQYGPREAQLAAALSDKYSANVMNMNKLQQSGLRSNGQLMSTGLNFLNKSGLLNKGASYLGNMFSGDATNGNGGYTSGGTTYNNPSAYTAPSSSDSSGGDDYWS